MAGFGLDGKDKAVLGACLAAVSVAVVAVAGLAGFALRAAFGASGHGVGFMGAFTLALFVSAFMLMFLFVAAGKDNIEGERGFMALAFAGMVILFTCAFASFL